MVTIGTGPSLLQEFMHRRKKPDDKSDGALVAPDPDPKGLSGGAVAAPETPRHRPAPTYAVGYLAQIIPE
jgi:hypothetical protein